MKQHGFSLIEIMLAGTLIAIWLGAITTSLLYGSTALVQYADRAQAHLLATEGLQAARAIRNRDYANLVNGTFGVDSSGAQWEFAGVSDQVDQYTRAITVSDALSEVKDIVVQIDWTDVNQVPRSLTLASQLSNWQKIVEAAVDWTTAIVQSSFSPPGSNNDIFRISLDGDYLHAVTINGSQDYFIFDVSDPDNLQLAASYSISGRAFDIYAEDSIVYITSSNNSNELIVLDVSDPLDLSILDTVNLNGNQNAQNLFKIAGEDTLYLTRSGGARDFQILDVSDPSDVTPQGFLNLNGRPEAIVVDPVTEIAYVGTTGREYQVVDVSNPNIPVLLLNQNLSGGSNIRSITKSGDYLYFGRDDREIYVVDVTIPAAYNQITTVDVNETIYSLITNGDYLFAGLDSGATEFAVFDLDNAPNISLDHSVNLANDALDLEYDTERDLIFASNRNNSNDIYVLTPN